MKDEYLNKIAKEAQNKFDIAKQLILEEMQDCINEIDQSDGSEAAFQRILNDFRSEYEECCCEQKCACDGEFDFDSDYREISVLVDGEDVAVEYDDDMEESDVVVSLMNAIVNVLAVALDERQTNMELVSHKEIRGTLFAAFDSAVTELAFISVMNALKGGKSDA